ncbi:MAG TPA: response regulator transcription factor [Verrucomicrobiae bacterium]|nr:response regulator transcription factor [Verrucomicrobiae bacterium]
MKIVLVDDHEIVLEGLKLVLRARPNTEVVGEATDAAQALTCIRAAKPDVVMLDMELPQSNGVLLTRQILQASPDIRIIIFSAHVDPQLVSEAVQEGVSGYLTKVHRNGEIGVALDAVEKGQLYLCAEAATALAQDYRKMAEGKEARLSEREVIVLRTLAEGRSTKEMAADLKVSVKTVETHRSRIMQKLNIHTVAGLTKYAVRHGLSSL